MIWQEVLCLSLPTCVTTALAESSGCICTGALEHVEGLQLPEESLDGKGEFQLIFFSLTALSIVACVPTGRQLFKNVNSSLKVTCNSEGGPQNPSLQISRDVLGVRAAPEFRDAKRWQPLFRTCLPSGHLFPYS